jgi:DNA-binding beta-propeller fold protein YncE
VKTIPLLLVPLVLFAQFEVDTIIRLPRYPEPSPGSFLTTAAYLPDLNKLYVASYAGHYFVVDCTTYQVESLSVEMWGAPHYSWNWRRQKLYATCNPDPDGTVVIDAAADSVIRWLYYCDEMNQDEYLSDVDCLYKPAVDTLYAFDGATDSVVRRRTLGGVSTCVSWDSAGQKLYVGQGGRKQLYVYDYIADSVLKVIDVHGVGASQPDAILFNNTCHKGYVGSFQVEPGPGSVGIIDTERDTLVGVVPVRIWYGLDAQVAVDERDDKVYLADNNADPMADTLWVVDCATDSVLKKIEYEHQGYYGTRVVRWVPWSNRLYLAISFPDSVHHSSLAVLDCNTDSIICFGMLLNSGGINDIQLDPVRQRIFVVGVDTNDVYVLRDTGYGVAETKPAGSLPSELQVRATRGWFDVRYSIASPGRVDLSVYDLMGRGIRRLVAEQQPAGPHSAVWNGRDHGGAAVVPGVYFIRLDTPGFRAVKKVVVAK